MAKRGSQRNTGNFMPGSRPPAGRKAAPGGKPAAGRKAAPGGKPAAGRKAAPGGKPASGRKAAPGGKPAAGGQRDAALPPKTAPEAMRLNRYLAHAGLASRRKADELIAAGLVQINGETVQDMGRMVQPGDRVNCQGKAVTPQRFSYVLLNKPRGFLTTTDDDRGRRTVMELVARAASVRLYPVGRLDRNTSGLLLLTNDGALAETLMHPRYEVEKVYAATLDKPFSESDMEQLRKGIELEDGPIRPDEMAFPNPADHREVGIALHSGRNRIVRRIFEALGYEVIKLDRVVYAGLTKKDLPRGKWRYLTPEELRLLKHFGGGKKGARQAAL
jgi:23S rRNA pseudouridine2605 synthase